MKNQHAILVVGRLAELPAILKQILRRLRLSTSQMEIEMGISSATVSRMRSAPVSAEVYLRIFIFVLRHIDRRMERGLLPPDYEVGMIRRILCWYKGEKIMGYETRFPPFA